MCGNRLCLGAVERKTPWLRSVLTRRSSWSLTASSRRYRSARRRQGQLNLVVNPQMTIAPDGPRVAAIALIGFSAVVFAVVLYLVPGGDVVESHYRTLQEARDDALFERGWIPNILPASTVALRVRNELDLDISAGEFRYAPSDHQAFWSKLAASLPFNEVAEDILQEIRRREANGFVAGAYVFEGRAWYFFCKSERGYCEYLLYRVAV